MLIEVADITSLFACLMAVHTTTCSIRMVSLDYPRVQWPVLVVVYPAFHGRPGVSFYGSARNEQEFRDLHFDAVPIPKNVVANEGVGVSVYMAQAGTPNQLRDLEAWQQFDRKCYMGSADFPVKELITAGPMNGTTKWTTMWEYHDTEHKKTQLSIVLTRPPMDLHLTPTTNVQEYLRLGTLAEDNDLESESAKRDWASIKEAGRQPYNDFWLFQTYIIPGANRCMRDYAMMLRKAEKVTEEEVLRQMLIAACCVCNETLESFTRYVTSGPENGANHLPDTVYSIITGFLTIYARGVGYTGDGTYPDYRQAQVSGHVLQVIDSDIWRCGWTPGHRLDCEDGAFTANLLFREVTARKRVFVDPALRALRRVLSQYVIGVITCAAAGGDVSTSVGAKIEPSSYQSHTFAALFAPKYLQNMLPAGVTIRTRSEFDASEASHHHEGRPFLFCESTAFLDPREIGAEYFVNTLREGEEANLYRHIGLSCPLLGEERSREETRPILANFYQCMSSLLCASIVPKWKQHLDDSVRIPIKFLFTTPGDSSGSWFRDMIGERGSSKLIPIAHVNSIVLARLSLLNDMNEPIHAFPKVFDTVEIKENPYGAGKRRPKSIRVAVPQSQQLVGQRSDMTGNIYLPVSDIIVGC